MLSKIKSPIAAGVVMASLALGLNAGDALAGSTHRQAVVVRPRPSPYAAYYYSRWNPHSLYSIYDHLSGGRQLCHLPTEPCDNNHHVQN